MELHYESLTADQILKIQHPYELFGTTSHKSVLKKLLMIWHPDRNDHKQASDVSAHILNLGNRADNGDWGNMLTVYDLVSDKIRYHFKYKKKVKTDLGDMYIGRKMVLFDVPKENEDLYKIGVSSIQGIKYQTEMLRQNFHRFSPRDLHEYRTDNGMAVTMYKGQDQICLSDLIEAKYDFQIGHLSWIVSGLYHFALFMEQSQHKMFGGLSLDGIFINPNFRSVHFLGGWWFTQTLDKPMVGLPNWLIPYIPASILTAKKATAMIDQIAIRCIALRLLGDTTMVGSKLIMDKKNKPVIQFLRGSAQKSLITDYENWLKIEKDLPRLDVLMKFNDLYQ